VNIEVGLLHIWVAQQSVTKMIPMTLVNLVTPKAGARHELLFKKPTCQSPRGALAIQSWLKKYWSLCDKAPLVKKDFLKYFFCEYTHAQFRQPITGLIVSNVALMSHLVRNFLNLAPIWFNFFSSSLTNVQISYSVCPRQILSGLSGICE
jgi:hypothetical protein